MINNELSKEVNFINGLKEDLEELRTKEHFQRHTPDYYAERVYYNLFHEQMPHSLQAHKCYLAFVKSYIENGESLFIAIKKFVEAYEYEVMG